MKKLLSCLLPLFPLCYAGAAVNPAIVPADARWVIYADLNALRASAPGKEIVALAEKAQVDAGKAKIGVDVQKLLATVGTITAYGTNFTSDPKAVDGTLVLQGTPELRKIAEGLLVQQNVTNPEVVVELKDLPFPAYGIRPPHQDDKNAEADRTQLVVAFPPEPIVLVSKSPAQLLKARDAFRGSLPTVARTPDAPLRDLLHNATDAFFYAASIVPSDDLIPADKPQARILKMTSSGSAAIGERGSNTYAHVVLVASSDDTADKLNKILQGMTAVLSLAETNDKQLADFLNSAKVVRDNRFVTLDLSYASDRLAEMIRNIAQEHGRPERHGPSRGPDNGEKVGEWTAEAVANATSETMSSGSHTIDNVTLRNGAVITLSRQSNGGRAVQFKRVEITPAAGGAPLSFKTELMRNVSMGPRGNAIMFEFPGADGSYSLKVTYTNDPEGKATYAVRVKNPKPDNSDQNKPATPPAAGKDTE